MLRELPFKTIGDVGRHGLELHVYCSSCYAIRLVSTDDTRWRDRLFAMARFRCTGQRHTGRPLRRTRRAEDPTGRTATGRRPGNARVPVVQLMHLGDRPGPARQAAMVGKQRTLSLPWLPWCRRVAHTWPSVAAGRAVIDSYR